MALKLSDFKSLLTTGSTIEKANRFSSWLVLLMGVILSIELSTSLWFYGIDMYAELELTLYVVTCVELIVSFFISRWLIKKGNQERVKYWIIGSLLIATSLFVVMYGDVIWITPALVIFVTTLYYKPRFTICVGIIAFILNIVLSVVALYIPPYVLYSTTYPIDGTVLTLSGDVSIANQLLVDDGWINYDRSVYSTLMFNLIDGILGYCAITAICVAVSYLANRAVEKASELAAKQERVSLEFSAAAEMQQNMLTDISKVFKNKKELDIWALMNPAREVGGDFYIAQHIDDHRVGFLVADVSGKGMAAALFASNARALCSWPSYAARKSPAEILTSANNELCAGNDSMMFVTLWMGELDLDTGVLKYCNAGHNPPLVRVHRENGYAFEYLKEKSGPILGVRPNCVYQQFELQMQPGDTLVLYTDGVNECFNADNEEYGEERLYEFLNTHDAQNCRELVDSLHENVQAFANGAEQFDDITLMAVKLEALRSNEEPLQIASQTRFYAAVDQNLDDMKDFVRTELRSVELDDDTVEVVTACVEELFVNINHYAYDKPGGGQCINIWSEASKKHPTDTDRRTLHLEIIDSGVPFNPLEDAAAPNLGPANQRPVGGLGIFMVRQVMDEVSYRYSSGCNILELAKEI